MTAADAVLVAVPRSAFSRLAQEILARKVWIAFVIVIGGLVGTWLLRGHLTSYGVAAVNAKRLLLPLGSSGSPLGTDEYGRDELARLISGTPVSLLAGVVPAAAGMAAGVVIGLAAATLGGIGDRVIMAIMDVMLAFPFILTAILAVVILGPSLQNAMIAVAVAIVPRNARIIRSEALSLRERDFVIAARLSGLNRIDIMWRHLLPNVLPTALIVGSTEVGSMITATAGLSFLGLGTQPPAVDWGSLISDGSQYLSVAPQLALLPIALLAIVSLTFVALADDLRRRLASSEPS